MARRETPEVEPTPVEEPTPKPTPQEIVKNLEAQQKQKEAELHQILGALSIARAWAGIDKL